MSSRGRGNYQGGAGRGSYQGGAGRGAGGSRGRGGFRGGRGGGGIAPENLHTVQVDNRRHRTVIRDELEEHFQKEAIEVGDTLIDDKLAPGTIGKPQTLQTNAFGIKMDHFPLFQYNIEITAKKRDKAKDIFLTKRSNEDFIAADRKAKCKEAWQLIHRKFPNIFNPNNRYFYDLQSSFMSDGRLPEGEHAKTLRAEELASTKFLKYFSLSFLIKPCETKLENGLTSDDMTMARLRDLDKFDRSHQAFIEMASSQYSLFQADDVICLSKGKIYLVNPEKYMNPSVVTNCNNFSKDKFIRFGVKKSAKYVEGPKGRGGAFTALFLDSQKTCFYKSVSIADFILGKGIDPEKPQDMRNFNYSNIRNLHVYNKHLSGKRTFEVTGLDRASARTKTFQGPNGKISVEDYFKEKYGIKLRYPNAPLVMGKGKTDLLPMEVAIIDDNQAVPKNKMAQFEDAKMIRAAALPPSNQAKEVQKYVGALGLNSPNNFKNYGIELMSQLTVTGRVLEQPTIVYDGGKAENPKEDGVWESNTFLRKAVIKKWALIKNGIENVDMRSYQQRFVRMAKNRGISIPEIPELIGKVSQERPLESYFQQAKQGGFDFMAFVTDERIKNQGELKMLERKYEIVTQNVKAQTANDAATRGTATLDNIVAKTNPKMGGTNYTIKHNQPFINEAFGTNPLIIGIALSHAGSVDKVQQARGGTSTSTDLSSVGYAANTGLDAWEFIGDHLPNTAYRSEIIELMPGIIKGALVRFMENRKCPPSSLILYLNGSSEGDFAMLKRFEVPLARLTMNQIINREVPLTVIVPQRSHIARIYKSQIVPSDPVPRQNVQPGVVVDTGLVHPTHNEFYLNAHTAIQGTARTPKYTIIYNNNPKASMDPIQHLTYYLCFAHQIVCSPTSLPSPVYIAMDYAERGTKVYKVLPEELKRDPLRIVQEFSFDTSEILRNKRVNA